MDGPDQYEDHGVSLQVYLRLLAYRFGPSVLKERNIIKSEQRRFSYHLKQ
jgi:hypothetical protein